MKLPGLVVSLAADPGDVYQSGLTKSRLLTRSCDCKVYVGVPSVPSIVRHLLPQLVSSSISCSNWCCPASLASSVNCSIFGQLICNIHPSFFSCSITDEKEQPIMQKRHVHFPKQRVRPWLHSTCKDCVWSLLSERTRDHQVIVTIHEKVSSLINVLLPMKLPGFVQKNEVEIDEKK